MDHSASRQLLRHEAAGGVNLFQSGLEIDQLRFGLMGETALDPLHLEAEHQGAAQQQRRQSGEQHSGKNPIAEGAANPFLHTKPLRLRTARATDSAGPPAVPPPGRRYIRKRGGAPRLGPGPSERSGGSNAR